MIAFEQLLHSPSTPLLSSSSSSLSSPFTSSVIILAIEPRITPNDSVSFLSSSSSSSSSSSFLPPQHLQIYQQYHRRQLAPASRLHPPAFSVHLETTTTTFASGNGGGGGSDQHPNYTLTSVENGTRSLFSTYGDFVSSSPSPPFDSLAASDDFPRWWALSAFVLVLGTAAGNVLVCLAIYWERRLQNVTNYFLMSLAITDLMVAILVMPMGILALVQGYFPLAPVYCLAWICLDVLFCTASIMHLCTISVDRYLSLRYPMSFGRNKTRRRVTLKIIVVWILSFALSLPLSLMYSQDYDSLLINGTCQIPNPTYRVIGSIVSFYIPLIVMLVTYWLTVKLLDKQHKNLGMPQSNGWGTSGEWSSSTSSKRNLHNRKYTWRRLMNYQTDAGERDTMALQSTNARHNTVTAPHSLPSSETATPRHHHFSSATSSDTEYTTLDTQDLWLPDCEPTPSTLSALYQFGKEMLKLSSDLQNVNLGSNDRTVSAITTPIRQRLVEDASRLSFNDSTFPFRKRSIDCVPGKPLARNSPEKRIRRSASFQESSLRRSVFSPKLATREDDAVKCSSCLPAATRSDHLPRIVHVIRKPGVPPNTTTKKDIPSISGGDSTTHCGSETASGEDELLLPANCRCPYFGGKSSKSEGTAWSERKDVVIIYSENVTPKTPLVRWETRKGRNLANRRSSFSSSCPSGTTTTVVRTGERLRRCVTLKQANSVNTEAATGRSIRNSDRVRGAADHRIQSARNSSLMIRNTSKHSRIIRSEQKATKVLGVVFFTFVILWAPFFVLNLIPTVCDSCEEQIPQAIFDIATWLGYASSMVNPIFYTIFNNVFRQAFKKVLLCKYRGDRRHRWKPVKH